MIDSPTAGHVHAPRSDSPGHPVAVVTGATGYIGRHVCRALLARGWRVRASVRTMSRAADLEHSVDAVPWDLEREDAPSTLVAGARAIIHLAGLAHRMGRPRGDELARYRRINVDATRSLLRAARLHDIPRFVHVSSVKVLGEGEASPYGPDAAPRPSDAYALSKAEAEEVVQRESEDVRWTIVRPAFVYGGSGRGNFVRLLTLARIASWCPLPLGGLTNRRSLIYVENLADLLVFCAESEATVRRVLPGVDTQRVSTPELLRAVAASMGMRVRLYALPRPLLSLVARAAGRAADWHRLSNDFEIDTAVLREIGWSPPVSFEESFRRSAASVAARQAA